MHEDAIQAAIMENFPVVSAPLSGELNVPEKFGTRYIVARQHLLYELCTPWLYFRMPIARIGKGLATPFGDASPLIRFKCKPVPMEIWSEFMVQARNDSPNEAAALALWNVSTGAWRLAMRKPKFVSANRIEYIEPEIADEEVAVVDIHSHGLHKAFFSRQDDQDDAGGIKIAVVWGNVPDQRPGVAARLVCPGHFIPLRMTDDGWFEVKEGAHEALSSF